MRFSRKISCMTRATLIDLSSPPASYVAFPPSLKPCDRELLRDCANSLKLPNGSSGVKPHRQFVISHNGDFGPFELTASSTGPNKDIAFYKLTPHAYKNHGESGEMEKNLGRVHSLFVKEMIRPRDNYFGFRRLGYSSLGDCSELEEVDVKGPGFTLVDSLEKLREMAAHLNSGAVSVFGFDLEMTNLALYSNCVVVCLLQVTTVDNKDYVVDTLVEEVREIHVDDTTKQKNRDGD